MAAVERWEYRRVYVSWNDTLGDWVCRFTDRDDIQGFDQVLNYFGQYGWELVSVEPQMWEALNYAEHNMGQVPPGESGSLHMYRTTGWAVGGYNCFFRRRG